ncbi:MAG: PAS domain-containing protein, partial [Desulfobacterales bacterium]|nr:PAS domain-containing protein [Desulfobacterales bacterium]
VDFLNGIAAAFQPDKGTLFLYNDHGQILAHPRITSSSDMAVKTVDQAVPPGLDMDRDALAALPENRITRKDGFLILKAALFQAPWQVVYLEPLPGLWTRIKTGVGPGTILLFTGLLALVLLVLMSTHYLFVVPADKFIKFILDCSQGRRPAPPYGVPRMWKPWFATIDRTFEENEQLTGRIRQYNEELEVRVTRRTAELIRLNTTLNAEILAREKAQDEEQRMARILDQAISQSPSGIVIADAPDMRIHTANRAAFEIRGQLPDKISEQHVRMAFDDWEIFDTELRRYPVEKLPLFRAIRGGEIVRNEEIIVKDLQDRDHWLIVNASPVTDSRGEIVAGIVIFHDITTRKQIEKEKLDAQKFALEQAKHALVGQVAGKMAHDFNNILGVIMGNAELALVECRNREMKRIFSLILGQTHRGKNLTKNLVAFARDQEPKQAFFHLNGKIDLVLDLMKKDLARIWVETRYEPDLPKLLADPGMIEHMLVNLIQNAVHAVSRADRP